LVCFGQVIAVWLHSYTGTYVAI